MSLTVASRRQVVHRISPSLGTPSLREETGAADLLGLSRLDHQEACDTWRQYQLLLSSGK